MQGVVVIHEASEPSADRGQIRARRIAAKQTGLRSAQPPHFVHRSSVGVANLRPRPRSRTCRTPHWH